MAGTQSHETVTRYRVCSYVGPHGETCPELLAQGETQCARGHGRPKNARWSKDRDGAEQNRFRAKVLERDGSRCTRCGSTWKLVAHHIRPGYEPECGITLCGRCHGQVDKHARA